MISPFQKSTPALILRVFIGRDYPLNEIGERRKAAT